VHLCQKLSSSKSLTIFHQEYLSPIVTPFELELALQDEMAWTGRYVLDFEAILAESKAAKNADTSVDDPSIQQVDDTGSDHDIDQPRFSLVSGKYRQAKVYGGKFFPTFFPLHQQYMTHL
jgi:diphthamide biosynthesis protein 2